MTTSNQENSRLAELLKKWIPFFGCLPEPFNALEFGTIKVKFNYRMRSRAGVCKPSENLIELNPHVLKLEPDLEEVLVHELCHMSISRRWPYAQSHGAKWKKLMNLCGFVGDRCHDLAVTRRFSQRRWEVNCSCQKHLLPTVTYNRIKKGARYKCLTCGSRLQI